MEPATDLEFLPIFRDEAAARLDSFVATLRELDPEAPAPEAMDLLRREAHTIKGAAGMVGLMRAHRLAHALEDVCRSAQEDGGALGDDLVEILMRAADALRAAVEGQDAESAPRPHLHAVPTNGNGNGAAVADSGRKVLVVDDSFTLRELQRRILERAGYEVVLAEDGVDALKTLEGDEVEVLVTDIDMPNLDGFGLVEAVRADTRFASIPVIIVTSRDADEDRRRGIELGADEYVVKGAFHEQTLLETVARLTRV
jgi:CheY-like chemotaxis protein/HPt (histidine-containing phosphotransfer) domain-containing protein